ncbi:MAG: DUF378 domain-containing protein [Patescibacteria group bacterium]
MMSDKMCGVHKLGWVLVFIGGVNWGLIGLFNWNLVEAIFSGVPVVVRIVYILVGLSALAMLGCGKCKACKK